MNLVSLNDVISERFPEFDDWFANQDRFIVSAIQGDERSAIMEALEAQLTIIEKEDSKEDLATGAIILFLFGLYLGHSGQGWLDFFKGKRVERN